NWRKADITIALPMSAFGGKADFAAKAYPRGIRCCEYRTTHVTAYAFGFLTLPKSCAAQVSAFEIYYLRHYCIGSPNDASIIVVRCCSQLADARRRNPRPR